LKAQKAKAAHAAAAAQARRLVSRRIAGSTLPHLICPRGAVALCSHTHTHTHTHKHTQLLRRDDAVLRLYLPVRAYLAAFTTRDVTFSAPDQAAATKALKDLATGAPNP